MPVSVAHLASGIVGLDLISYSLFLSHIINFLDILFPCVCLSHVGYVWHGIGKLVLGIHASPIHIFGKWRRMLSICQFWNVFTFSPPPQLLKQIELENVLGLASYFLLENYCFSSIHVSHNSHFVMIISFCARFNSPFNASVDYKS